MRPAAPAPGPTPNASARAGTGGNASAALPGLLRKHQRALIAELREIATETHTLHRIWYKHHAQLRHMVWWRRVRCVRQLGCRIATGPLARSVPTAGSMRAAPSMPSETACVPLAADAHVLGTELLWRLAQAYTSLWDQDASGWERYVRASLCSLPRFPTPPSQKPRKSVYVRALRAAQALRSAVKELERRSQACFVYVCPTLTHRYIQAHLTTPPAPMHAALCMALVSVCAHLAAVCERMVLGPGESLDRLCRILATKAN